ncbi:GNAT family N-acetyltransferase [Pseudomonas sp. RIT-PI-S]|uniref:GNAT family N-acetyltransferase n=1 Tax=Pseudomonas sp. RIT-PI-S TaxID=3035295 RepID=UPI0021D94B33|nr:GNAT family N-acetyltransferase [Pseudomonas sp. RIT-PI-S]
MASLSLPCPNGHTLHLDLSAGTLALDDGSLARREGDTWRLSAAAEPVLAVWALAYSCFAADAGCQAITLRLAQAPAALLQQGLLHPAEAGCWHLERAAFWQVPSPWLRTAASNGYPLRPVISDGRRHPRRPPKPSGEVYRRFDAALGSWVSLRVLDRDLDLALFHRWQNHPRVDAFWNEAGSLAQHRAYLERQAADPHAFSLIGCFDDEPFGYFEAYWAKEDRIAPFYAVDDYDRGIHMLVGEEHHRGPHKIQSWLPALVHYLFLDDSRTQRVVAEPRADNARMIGHMQRLGFWQEKEFDFPHKRAALMVQSRERFFDRCGLR